MIFLDKQKMREFVISNLSSTFRQENERKMYLHWKERSKNINEQSENKLKYKF